jgi:hypothetical protein
MAAPDGSTRIKEAFDAVKVNETIAGSSRVKNPAGDRDPRFRPGDLPRERPKSLIEQFLDQDKTYDWGVMSDEDRYETVRSALQQKKNEKFKAIGVDIGSPSRYPDGITDAERARQLGRTPLDHLRREEEEREDSLYRAGPDGPAGFRGPPKNRRI